ncbi:MAG: ABC transporter ATP-binding protein [Faecousia sp.]
MKRKKITVLGVFLSVLRRNILLSAVLLAAIAGSILTGILPPLALEAFVAHLTEGNEAPFYLVLLYVGLLVLSGLSDTAREALIIRFGQKITHGLRSAMCDKLTRMQADYFVSNKPGATVSRFVNDVDTVEALFTTGIVSMVVDVCKVGSILAVIFVKSEGLGLLMVAVAIVLFALTRLFQKRMLLAQMDKRAAVARTSGHIPETIRNIRMIHTYSRERFMEEKYQSYIQQGFEAIEKNNVYDSVYSPIVIVISAVLVGVMMVLSALGGGFRQLFGISAATAVAVIDYVSKVFAPLESIGMELQCLQSAIAGLRRLREFFGEPEREIGEEIPGKTEKTDLEFRDVHFGYLPDREILHGTSFRMEAGESVTLTGRTGAGKSTMLRLLLGLYRPQSGRILVGGRDADRIPDSRKRRLFGYVEQNIRLISGTVRDQITLGDPAITEQQVQKAIALSGLGSLIPSLENGLDTVCKPELFSQGQLQLLSIARAVAADPEILLLDEITANLDSETEGKVMDALREASQNRTVLTISHRLFDKGRFKTVSIDSIN